MESCIKQNNAIEIYQDYFNEIDFDEAPKGKKFTSNNHRSSNTLFPLLSATLKRHPLISAAP